MVSPDIRVLFISPLPPPMGGIASWTRIIADRGLPEGYVARFVNTGMRSHRHALKLRASIGEGWRALRIGRSLIWRLLRDRPHVVHMNCSLSALGIFRDLLCVALVRMWGIPVVTQYRGHVPNFANGRHSGISSLALRALIGLTQVNVALNKDSLEFIGCYTRHCHAPPVLLPNFVNDDSFGYRACIGQAVRKRPRIIYVGWIRAAKGCCEVLAVARQFAEVDFALVGPVMADMQQYLQALPANVTLYGTLERAAVFREMSLSDILLLPSHTEGFPNVVLEAMAIGLPVVATRVGAIPEMIEEGKGGLLVEPKDITGLGHALQTLLADPTLRVCMGQFNRKKCKTEYTYDVVLARLIHLYKNAMAE